MKTTTTSSIGVSAAAGQTQVLRSLESYSLSAHYSGGTRNAVAADASGISGPQSAVQSRLPVALQCKWKHIKAYMRLGGRK